MKKIMKLFAAAVVAGVLMGGNTVMANDRMTASENEMQILFGRQNPVAVAGDSEVTAMMGKMIYADAAQRSNLTAKKRQLLTLVVLAGSGAADDMPLHVQGALKAGATADEVRETVLQCTPYIGYAKAKPALDAVQEGLKKAGVKVSVKAATVNDDTRYADGLAVQKEIFGADHIDALHANTPADQKFTVDFLAANCFGDFYTRKVLDLKQREMITFMAIVSMGGCDPQVRAHVGANISVGNTRQDLLNAVAAMVPYLGYPRSLNAIACINAVAPEK